MFPVEIMDHYRRPRHYGEIAGANRATEQNPTCGDEVTVYVTVEGGEFTRGAIIESVGFTCAACAITKAAASMIAEAIRGRAVESIGDEPEFPQAIIAFLLETPSRTNCALIVWNALREACKPTLAQAGFRLTQEAAN